MALSGAQRVPLPASDVASRPAFATPSNAGYPTYSRSDLISSLSAILYGMLAVSVVLSGLLISVVTTVSVLDRTYELLTLRVLGYSPREIIWRIVLEGLAMMLLAAVLGFAAGYVASAAYISILAEEFAGKLFYLSLYVDPLTSAGAVAGVIAAGVALQFPRLQVRAEDEHRRRAKEGDAVTHVKNELLLNFRPHRCRVFPATRPENSSVRLGSVSYSWVEVAYRKI